MTVEAGYTDEDVYESLSLRDWEIGEPVPEPPPSAGDEGADRLDPKLWYPAADRSLAMPSQGDYPSRFPMGALVHFTAGRCDRGDPDAEATIRYGASQKHCYFCISRTGKVYQTAPLSRWGYHAGQSTYPGLGSYVHSKIVGIELCNAGLLTKTALGYEPYWNKPGNPKNTYYKEDDVRYVERVANITQRGYYLKYTSEQERSLIALILWMRATDPAVFKLGYVVGHDEVSPSRKNDPGGALSMLMPAFRTHLEAAAGGAHAAVSRSMP